MTMSREQRRRNGQHSRRSLSRLGLASALAILITGLSVSTCNLNSDIIIDSCESDEDCKHLPGTKCTHTFCQCQEDGETWCFGDCRARQECKNIYYGIDAGGGGGAGGAGGAGGSGG